jgi:hypothetical protein
VDDDIHRSASVFKGQACLGCEVSFAKGVVAEDEGRAQTAETSIGGRSMVLLCCTIDLDTHTCEFWQLTPSSSGASPTVWELTSRQAYDLPQHAIGRAMCPIVSVLGSTAVGVRFGPSSIVPAVVMRAGFRPLSSLRIATTGAAGIDAANIDAKGASARKAVSERSVAEPMSHIAGNAQTNSAEMYPREWGWGELDEGQELTGAEEQKEAMDWEVFLLSGKHNSAQRVT